MAALWIDCLVCKKAGEKNPEFDATWRTDCVPECPKCGNLDTKKMKPTKQLFHSVQVQARMKGDNRFDTDMDRAMDRANQRHIEDNWADYESGKKKLVVPKNRPKEFDPRQLHEKRLY